MTQEEKEVAWERINDQRRDDRMTENELKEIEARANAATPGPWRSHQPAVDFGYVLSEETVVADADGNPLVTDRVAGGMSTISDLDFISAAREDIPALIAEVRRLTTGADIKVHCPHCKQLSLTVVTGGRLIKNEPVEG